MKVVVDTVRDGWSKTYRCDDCHSIVRVAQDDVRARRDPAYDGPDSWRVEFWYGWSCPVCTSYNTLYEHRLPTQVLELAESKCPPAPPKLPWLRRWWLRNRPCFF